jgi:hypothetical protein
MQPVEVDQKIVPARRVDLNITREEAETEATASSNTQETPYETPHTSTYAGSRRAAASSNTPHTPYETIHASTYAGSRRAGEAKVAILCDNHRPQGRVPAKKGQGRPRKNKSEGALFPAGNTDLIIK